MCQRQGHDLGHIERVIVHRTNYRMMRSGTVRVTMRLTGNGISRTADCYNLRARDHRVHLNVHTNSR